MFGSHLSIAGGMTNALDLATELKLDCVQVFTCNQRQWKCPVLHDDDRDAWVNQAQRLGWHGFDKPHRTVAHNSYLINMASPDIAMRKKSINRQTAEIERCEALGIPLLVSHPGAHLESTRKRGEPNKLDGNPSKDELKGLKRIVKAIDKIHNDLPGYQTMMCLETTVGSGTNLGYDFYHLQFIREHVKQPECIGFCFDTCHITAAGYDMTTNAAATEVLEKWDQTCGFEHLRVFHLNDSKGGIGSRLDRHEHIGDGTCGKSCFRAILNHSELQDVPRILETPKENSEKGTPYDRINIRRLKRLVQS